MNVISGLHNETIEKLVNAFAETTKDVINDITVEYGMETGNFKNGGHWDIRFRRIKYVALHHDLVVLSKKRGLWTFVCILDMETGNLYVFTKENNLNIVMGNFGKNKIHYFHAFVSINSGPVELDNNQLSLFPILTSEYEERRLKEVQKILGEDYPLVNNVVFVVAKEEEKKIIGVKAQFYNRYFELLETQDWSAYVPEEEYGSLLILDDELDDNNHTVKVIPKIKQEIKDKKRHFEQKLSTEKKKEKNEEEEKDI